MKLRNIIFSIVTLTIAASCDETKVEAQKKELPTLPLAILCAEQADFRIKLVTPSEPDKSKSVLWSYPAMNQEQLTYRPTDAKRVKLNEEVFILAAYHGRVRLIRYSDKKLIKDYSSYGSCHSAELLPDGQIVSVSSNHGKLRLHKSSDTFVDYELPYAHGATWDKKRQCLWALGDLLYQFNYKEGNLTLNKKFKLPLSPTGHDLFPLRKEAKLLVTNNEGLFLFDIEKQEFKTLSLLKNIKSASQHSDESIWISESKRIEGASDWQSDSIIRLIKDDDETRHTIDGARFYKARWWQEVDFSY